MIGLEEDPVNGLAVGQDEVEVQADHEVVTEGPQEAAVVVAAAASTEAEVEAAPWKGHHGGIAKAVMM